jgi:hypothetical protein
MVPSSAAIPTWCAPLEGSQMVPGIVAELTQLFRRPYNSSGSLVRPKTPQRGQRLTFSFPVRKCSSHFTVNGLAPRYAQACLSRVHDLLGCGVESEDW